MSTKIYDAYICKLGFHYTHQIIEEIRKDYEEIIRIILKPVPKPLRKACLKQYEEDVIVIYPLANGNILFQIFTHNLPYDYINRRKVILSTIPLMITFNKIQDYHYQDQTDPWYAYEEPPLSPYNLAVAKLDYEQREKDWNEIFNSTTAWTPIEAGYTIPLIKDKLKLEWE